MPSDKLVLGVVDVYYAAVRDLFCCQSKLLPKMILNVVEHLRPCVDAEAVLECCVPFGPRIAIHTRTAHELSRGVLVTQVIARWRVFRPRNHRAMGLHDLDKR